MQFPDGVETVTGAQHLVARVHGGPELRAGLVQALHAMQAVPGLEPQTGEVVEL